VINWFKEWWPAFFVVGIVAVMVAPLYFSEKEPEHPTAFDHGDIVESVVDGRRGQVVRIIHRGGLTARESPGTAGR